MFGNASYTFSAELAHPHVLHPLSALHLTGAWDAWALLQNP